MLNWYFTIILTQDYQSNRNLIILLMILIYFYEIKNPLSPSGKLWITIFCGLSSRVWYFAEVKIVRIANCSYLHGYCKFSGSCNGEIRIRDFLESFAWRYFYSSKSKCEKIFTHLQQWNEYSIKIKLKYAHTLHRQTSHQSVLK